MKRKPNPIVAAAKRGLREGRQFLVILGKWEEQRPEMQLDIVRRFFTDEAVYEIGCLMIKDADHMFGRDREKVLLIPALWYKLTHWNSLMLTHKGDVQRSVNELKKGIEQHCNNGRKLDQYRWSRLRKVLGVPKRSSVRHDRNPVKFGEVGEIIDLAPPLAKKRRRRTSSTKRRKTVS
jgi:hypothetical protein